MKKTFYSGKQNIKLTIICIIILIALIIFFLNIFLMGFKYNEDNSLNLLYLLAGGSALIFLIGGVFSSLNGIIKGKKQINDNINRIKMDNPYTYYRELPNNYGIGVATLLLDSAIENEKDIVAVLLDLCAKGYLKLQKNINENYTITVLKPIDNSLLSNEKYILSCIVNKNIHNFNYNEWFNYCMDDGINLGLFTRNNQQKVDTNIYLNNRVKKINKYKKIYLIISIILTIILSFILSLILSFNSNYDSVIFSIGKFIFQTLFIFVGTLILLYIPVYWFPSFIAAAVNISKETAELSRHSFISNYLKPTKLGEIELQKLLSFKSFLNDFGTFAIKNPEEIVLWDFYLSYAQIFGLTDKILSTGYNKIIKNGSFEIDNLEAIHLNELTVIVNNNVF